MSRLILFFTVTSFSAAHCSSAETAPDTDARQVEEASFAKGDARRARDKNVSVAGELERIKKEAATAFETRDWSRARRLIAKGLNLAGEDKDEMEIDRAELLLKLGDIERESGRETEARRQYTDAMAIFHVHKNAEGNFLSFLSIGQLEVQKGDYAAASKQFASAEAIIPELKDKALIGLLKLQKGRLASRKTKPDEARNEFLEAIKIFENDRDKKNTAEALLLLSQEEDALERSGSCQSHLDKAAAIFRELGDLDGEARAMHRQAALAERDEKYNKARQLYQKVRELYEKLDRSAEATSVKRHIDSLPEPE